MNQPQSKMATSPKRRVTMNPTVTAVEILSIYDYTPSEIDATWYDEEGMDKITQRCFKVLQRMECGGTKNGQKYCTRGLEGHSTLGSMSKKKARTSAVAAVLEEQARQWNENAMDVQAISDAYRRTTSSCQMWACVIGNRDRQAIESYLYEEGHEEADANAAVYSNQSEESAIKRPSQRGIQEVASRAMKKTRTHTSNLVNGGGGSKYYVQQSARAA